MGTPLMMNLLHYYKIKVNKQNRIYFCSKMQQAQLATVRPKENTLKI